MGRKIQALHRVRDMIKEVIEPYGCDLVDKHVVYRGMDRYSTYDLDTESICFHVEHQQFGSIITHAKEVAGLARNAYYNSVYQDYVKLHREKEWINFMLPRRPGCPKWNRR